MLVKIFFNEDGEFQHVASVTASEDFRDYPNRALEYAYTSTQNIMGSWSRGPMIQLDSEHVVNADYNEDVKVVVPLPTFNGKTYGLRSSMVGDVFSVNDELYKVDYVGFQRIGTFDEIAQTLT